MRRSVLVGVVVVFAGCSGGGNEGGSGTVRGDVSRGPGVFRTPDSVIVEIHRRSDFTDMADSTVVGWTDPVPYSFDLSPGVYYAMAWFDANASGQLDTGDLWGYYTEAMAPSPIELAQGDTFVANMVLEWVGPSPDLDPIPLVVGNWWAYYREKDETRDTLRVLRDTLYDGHPAYLIDGMNALWDSVLTGGQDTSIAYYYGDFLHVVMTYDMGGYGTFTFVGQALKRSLRAGDSWNVFTYDTMFGLLHIQVDASVLAEEDVSVPAGDFSGAFAIRYTMDVSFMDSSVVADTFYNWIFPGVGSLKQDDDRPGASPSVVLEDYHVAGSALAILERRLGLDRR